MAYYPLMRLYIHAVLGQSRAMLVAYAYFILTLKGRLQSTLP